MKKDSHHLVVDMLNKLPDEVRIQVIITLLNENVTGDSLFFHELDEPVEKNDAVIYLNFAKYNIHLYHKISTSFKIEVLGYTKAGFILPDYQIVERRSLKDFNFVKRESIIKRLKVWEVKIQKTY